MTRFGLMTRIGMLLTCVCMAHPAYAIQQGS